MAHSEATSTSAVPLRLRTSPMLLLAACFAAGVLCRGWWQPAADAVITCALLLLIAFLAWLRAPRLMWPSLCLAWVALGWTAAMLDHPPDDVALLPYADSLQRTADARVISERRLMPRAAATETISAADTRGDEENAFAASESQRQPTQTLDLQVSAIEDVTPDTSSMVTLPQSSGVRVTLLQRAGQPAIAVPCGAHIQLTLRLHPLQRIMDPGVWQYADALNARGIGVESVADTTNVRVLDTQHTPACTLAAAQSWAVNRLQRLPSMAAQMNLPAAMQLTPQDAAMLSAMLAGDRTLLDRGLRTSFERTGSFHLFVVAGLHVALLLAALHWLLIKLRTPRWLAACIALTLTCGYAMLTGFGAPVQRALLMCAVFLLAQLFGRQRNTLNSVGAAALAMLLLHPAALFEAGFQMTVLAVFAIGGLAVPINERTLAPYARALHRIDFLRIDPHFAPRLAQFRISVRWLCNTVAAEHERAPQRPWRRFDMQHRMPAYAFRATLWLGQLILIALIAEMVMALPMAIYFHRATPFAAPANVLALPLVSVLMLCAVTTFVTSLIHPLLAAAPAACTALLLHGITAVIGSLSSLRGADVRMPAPLFAYSLAALALWMFAMWLLREQSPWRALLGAALLPVGLLLVLWPRRPQLYANTLEFTAIDVGQGDSLLVSTPSQQTMLIDAGGPTGSPAMAEQSSFDVGQEVVSLYLWSRGIRQLDAVVLTHAHTDHIGGMGAVLRNFRPHELWLSTDANTPQFHALIREAASMGITVRHLRAGETANWGGAEFRVLNPAADYTPRSLPTNDDSLALRIAYGRASVLAEGDAERASEDLIVSQHTGPVTLLKVGHHGSNTSTEQTLLDALQPRAAVISCGRNNRFGHPRMPVLQRLQAAGVRTGRTDALGPVQYLLHANGGLDIHMPMAEIPQP